MFVELPLSSTPGRRRGSGALGGPLVVDVRVEGAGTDGPAAAVARSDPGSPLWAATVPAGPASQWLADVVGRLRDDVLHGDPVRWGRPGSVHAFGWRAAVVTAAAGLQVPVVAHLEDGVPRAPGGCLVDGDERLAWAAARSADLVVLDSSWAVERATARGVRRSGVVRDLPVAAEVAGATPWRVGPPEQPPTVVAVGGVGASAGTPLLVEAFAGLGARLLVAAPPGASAHSTMRARDWVRRLARAARADGPEPTVVPFSTALLDAADLVVDAGSETSSARGVVTAMACRRAVLASASGPRPEIIVPGATGELVDTPDRTSWRSAAIRLLQNPFKLEAYGEAGLERCTAGFSAGRRADLVHRLDQELSVASAQVA